MSVFAKVSAVGGTEDCDAEAMRYAMTDMTNTNRIPPSVYHRLHERPSIDVERTIVTRTGSKRSGCFNTGTQIGLYLEQKKTSYGAPIMSTRLAAR